MWPELPPELAKHACPNCGTVGTMLISLSSYRISCQTCRATNLDPFAVGPWDTKQRMVDWIEGEVVSLYVADNKDVPPAEPNPNWMEFLRDMFEGSNKRVVTKGEDRANYHASRSGDARGTGGVV